MALETIVPFGDDALNGSSAGVHRCAADDRAAPSVTGPFKDVTSGTAVGVAQGYVTDRVADLLQAEGCGRILLDLGEVRAIGRRPDGRAWRAAVALSTALSMLPAERARSVLAAYRPARACFVSCEGAPNTIAAT